MMKNKWEDHYTRKARDEKWLARSVYKLQEIDQKFKLIRKGSRILDLGCAPGSWSQYGIKRVGKQGEVIGIDCTQPRISTLPNFRFISADVLDINIKWLKNETGALDLVLSDLAPMTTGIKDTDINRSMILATLASEIALEILKNKGCFVCKIFEGNEIKSFKTDMKKYFRQIRLLKPQSTRKRSREIYLIGIDFTG